MKIDKGWHSEIFLTDKGTVIKKFKKNLIKNFEKEVYFLEKLKDFGFVPKIISYDKDNLEIEMEYINCKKLKDFIREKDKEEIKEVLLKILDICYFLDKMKIQKEEMLRPYDHIFICENRIVFIDWERAKEKENPSNLTQFIQFILTDKGLKEKGIELKKEEFINLLKEYKRSYSKDIFEKIKLIIKNI